MNSTKPPTPHPVIPKPLPYSAYVLQFGSQPLPVELHGLGNGRLINVKCGSCFVQLDQYQFKYIRYNALRALIYGDRVLSSTERLRITNYSERLLEAIEHYLNTNGIKVKQLGNPHD